MEKEVRFLVTAILEIDEKQRLTGLPAPDPELDGQFRFISVAEELRQQLETMHCQGSVGIPAAKVPYRCRVTKVEQEDAHEGHSRKIV